MLNLQCHLLNQVGNNTKTVKAFYSQRIGWLDGITDAIDVKLGKLRGEGQGDLACCSPWGCKESDMPGQLSNKKALQMTMKGNLLFI